jgi:hypothetical protein
MIAAHLEDGMAVVDRIGLGLVVLLAAFLFFIGETGPNPKFLDGDWWQAYWDSLFLVSLKFILPLWLVLRFADLVSGGPARRRGRFTVRPLN